MQGYWIPIQKALSRRLEVIRLGVALGRSRQEVVGWLVEFWSWVDEECSDGLLPGLTPEALDTVLGAPTGFAKGLMEVAWLVQEGASLRVPSFDRWLGRSAKRRLQESQWKAGQRAAQSQAGVDNSRTGTRTTREENTGEERGGSTPLPPASAEGSPTTEVERFLSVWNRSGKFTVCTELSGARRKLLERNLREPAFANNWQQAIAIAESLPWATGALKSGWRATVDWFLRPVTLARLLEGGYSGTDQKKRGRTVGDYAAKVKQQRQQSQSEKPPASDHERSRALLKEALDRIGRGFPSPSEKATNDGSAGQS